MIIYDVWLIKSIYTLYTLLHSIVLRKEKLRPHLFYTTRRHPTIPPDLVPLFRGFALCRVRFPRTRRRFLSFCCTSFRDVSLFTSGDILYIKHPLYPGGGRAVYFCTCIKTHSRIYAIQNNIYA